ncbi:MAG: hypothetical protein J7578_07720 [Chitinophagaceae bacterium]|nr:hypothetical protein [Chitinophagaceae bacterium]
MKGIVLILLHLVSFSCFAQSNNSEENTIATIRKEFTAINNPAKKYKVVEAEVEGLSTEGGSIKKYYDSTVLRKAILTLYGETGTMVMEYYFTKDKLIFVYEKNTAYDKPIYQGKVKVVSTIESRFYFEDQKLIRWIEDKKTKEKALYAQREKEILSDLAGDLKLIQ